MKHSLLKMFLKFCAINIFVAAGLLAPTSQWREVITLKLQYVAEDYSLEKCLFMSKSAFIFSIRIHYFGLLQNLLILAIRRHKLHLAVYQKVFKYSSIISFSLSYSFVSTPLSRWEKAAICGGCYWFREQYLNIFNIYVIFNKKV